MKLSIIIVNYKVEKELFACIKSITQSKQKIKYEIIIVDNDEEKKIETKLKIKFPNVLYINSYSNIGFGAGNNLGARNAKGEYLFFLNPDTIVFPNAIYELVNFLEEYNNADVVAPLLLKKDRKPYLQQGTKNLGILEGIVCLSFINKLFPQNSISKKYFLQGWDKQNSIEVDVIPGTAFVIRKSLFDKVGGFDEKFFLYFEEFDLCKRLKKIGGKIFILPQSKVIHFWGKSTSTIQNASLIFAQSRFLYFKKHNGAISAFLVEIFARMNKYFVIIFFVLILSMVLRFYRLNELMAFIPDQGWFYLSARDIIITGKIPLIGPETSHPWIHHGPLWTYTLAIILWVFNFHPVPPAYFTAILGTVTVWLLYKVTSELFSKRIGIIATFLFATSPFIVLASRMPYHTSPIPFFTLLLVYSVSKWLKGNKYFLPAITFLIGVLYNHEFTTFVLFIPIFLIIYYGFWKKKAWVIGILNWKIIIYSLFAFFIPMLPFVIYDINHGYKQTVGFLVWLFYRIIKFPLNILQSHDVSLSLLQQQSFEFLAHLQRLIFEPNLWVSLLIFVSSIIYLFYLVLVDGRNKKLSLGIILLFLYLSISTVGLFMHRIPIEADTLLISPFIIMAISVIIDRLANIRSLRIILIYFIVFMCFTNSYFLFKNYLTAKSGENRMTFSDRINAVESIIKIVKGKEYNLIGRGELDNFPVFTMTYEYLLWWKGHPPRKENVELNIVVWEKEGKIFVYEQK